MEPGLIEDIRIDDKDPGLCLTNLACFLVRFGTLDLDILVLPYSSYTVFDGLMYYVAPSISS